MADASNWKTAPLDRLVDHIVLTHHGFMQRMLPLLAAQLLEHVRSYWMQHPEVMQANTLFQSAKTQLDMHFIQEETAGFPLIRRHAHDKSVAVTPFLSTAAQHRTLHAQALRELETVRSALWDGKAPADVGPEVAVTLQQLDAVIADLKVHIYLENDVLMQRLEAGARTRALVHAADNHDNPPVPRSITAAQQAKKPHPLPRD